MNDHPHVWTGNATDGWRCANCSATIAPTAPDRPGDRDQQQAAREDAVDAWQAESTVYHYASYTTGYLAARAEEAARWRAKIEALAELEQHWAAAQGKTIGARVQRACADDVRALLDES